VSVPHRDQEITARENASPRARVAGSEMAGGAAPQAVSKNARTPGHQRLRTGVLSSPWGEFQRAAQNTALIECSSVATPTPRRDLQHVPAGAPLNWSDPIDWPVRFPKANALPDSRVLSAFPPLCVNVIARIRLFANERDVRERSVPALSALTSSRTAGRGGGGGHAQPSKFAAS